MRDWNKELGDLITDQALADGVHVHRVYEDNTETCAGGDADCPLWQQEAEFYAHTWGMA